VQGLEKPAGSKAQLPLAPAPVQLAPLKEQGPKPTALPEPRSFVPAWRRRDIVRRKHFQSLRSLDWQLYLLAIRRGTPSRSFVHSPAVPRALREEG
jgi:hypothetical protein